MTEQPPRRRSATLAATLSFVVPGLGQLALGSVRRGLLYLLPVAALVAFAAAGAAADPVRFLASLVRPDVLVGVFILNLCLFAWRSLASVDAWRTVAEGTPRGALTTVVVALLLATAATHVVIGATTYLAYDAVTAITGDEGFGALPAGSPASTLEPSPGATPTPTPEPTPSPTPAPPPLADGRLDILLIGADAGPSSAAASPVSSTRCTSTPPATPTTSPARTRRAACGPSRAPSAT